MLHLEENLADINFALLAQLVEQLPFKETVIGSNPIQRTLFLIRLLKKGTTEKMIILYRIRTQGVKGKGFPLVPGEILEGWKPPREDDSPSEIPIQCTLFLIRLLKKSTTLQFFILTFAF